MMIGGIIAGLKQANKKLAYSMIFSVVLISVFMAVFSVIIVDKYTKKVQLSKLDLMKKTGVQNLKFNSALWGLKRIILQMPVKKC
jgi:hypothetical protein